MTYQIPEYIKEIFNTVEKTGFQIYIVGGSVRDLIMGRTVNDWDFTTDAKPEEILKIFPEGYYDNKFGTVGIPISASKESNPTSQVCEITTMRKEGKYEDFRHPSEVGWTNKIEEDLARRDFTINTIALCLKNTKILKQAFEAVSPQAKSVQDDSYVLVDPFNGQEDIKNKKIKTVGDPDKRFREDALRLMRAIRISTELEFEIDKKTFLAIQKNARLIKEVANERIRDELFKILASTNPYMGIVKLREVGILQIILPELEKCFGVKQEGDKHARVYDIGEHSFLVLKETPSFDPLVRFAALIHDIGKPDTYKEDAGNVTFYNHDVVSGRLALTIANRFNLSKKQADKLFRLVRWHLFTVDERQTDSAIRRFIKNVGVENIDDMITLRIGDRLGGGTEKAVSWRMEEFQQRIKEVLKKPFSLSDLKVNGKDVMEVLNIPPSPKVGETLSKLFAEVLEDSSKNSKEYLMERVKKIS